MHTRDFLTETEIDNLEEAASASVRGVQGVAEPLTSSVTQEEVDEFQKFRERKREFKAEFAKFKMYRQRARELDEAEAERGHVNSPVTP